ncbi:hypothetical protein DdX_14302 [Ditylenchus destructor]|uniref:Uncharacterized protein n=1 Tax=Ditylenchus destructor TaxID=166010 RepID=A0AAD4MX65_9BILA|nr:hypothetical protein DdX_14302 [Ditylenchus destructor]
MDNPTMIETFKFLNYFHLAKNSLVSKRFWNLICTHRHKLALLDVNYINMDNYVASKDPALIRMFNKELSPGKYNELIVRNGYSKEVPLEGRIAGKECTDSCRTIYLLLADAYQNPEHCQDIATAVLHARTELKDDNWPLFQHFIRLLTDPFIHIGTLA